MNDNGDNNKEIDKLSGVETTGHEWDGLKELNNPAPRWWLWVFFITIIWSVGYWILYPSWPTMENATKGAIGWTQFEKLSAEQAEIAAIQKTHLDKFSSASLQDIMNDPQLYAFAVAGGRATFKENCATCHGTGGAGAKGYPNLNDDDWIWGGTLEDIYFTIQHGIRSTGEDTRVSQMPAFGKDGLLKPDQISAVADYVLALSGSASEKIHEQGQAIYRENCAACHGAEGKGDRSIGAPNLADQIWLYGGSRQAIYESVFYARKGVMPGWHSRLDENTIKALTIYLHELGGGEPDAPAVEPVDADPASADTEEPIDANGAGR